MAVRTCLFAVLLLLAQPARADEFADARRLEAQLEFEQALKIVDSLLARGGADPARFAELEMFAGRLAAGLDHRDIAQDHFARALVVKPDLALPEGTSPKLTEPFAAAKARTRALVVKVTVVHGLVTLATDDALGLAVGIAVHVVAGGAHSEVIERGALRAVIPDGAAAIEVAALDASGNRVWVGAPPAVIAEPAPKPVMRERPTYARWPAWAAVAGGSLAVTGIAAWRFSVAQDDWNTLHDQRGEFTELQAIERRGRRWGIAADIGFGFAAAAGVAAIVFAVRGSSVELAPDRVTVTRRF